MSPLADPLVFECPVAVSEDDIDVNGHVNNVVYLRWVQDAAAAHWLAVSDPAQAARLAWVVLRHEIDYLRPAFLTDDLRARTWVGGTSAATFERHVEIVRAGDGQAAARARTVWCMLDAGSGRPRRIDARLRALFEDRPT